MNKLEIISKCINVPRDLLEVVEYVKNKQAELVTREIQIGLVKFTTIDVKLPKFKEDSLYEDENIRTLIPRGLCFIFANDNYVYTVYGHPKFGNKGDFNKSLNVDSLKKIFRSKENGECAHWGAFEYLGLVYEVYGSKNVHLVVRSNNVMDDLLLYTDMRYDYAKKMATLINTKNTQLAVEYLVRTQNILCGEGCFVDSQHLVQYVKSDMFFFAVTNKRNLPTDPITKVSALDVDNLVTSLGLNKVLETFICNTDEETTEASNYFENKNNSEGAVVNCVDDAGNVVYVFKHKNFDYIFKRALREQMKKYAPTQRILKRFSELHIVHPNYDAMVDWALKFNAYYRQCLNDTERENFFNSWVTQSEAFNMLDEDEKMAWLVTHNEYELRQQTLEVIFFVAMPGSGKTFMARVISKILKHNKKNAKHLEQDMFFHLGQKSASKHYENAIANAIKDPNLDYLILAKSNHSHDVRNKTYATLSKCTRNINRTYVVMTANDQNMEETGKICVRRIMDRGAAHASLFGKSEDEVTGIIKGVFVKQWNKLDDSELSYDVINLDIDQPKIDVLNSFRTQAEVLGLGQFKVDDGVLQDIFTEIIMEDNEMIIKNENKNNKSNKK